MIDTLIYTKKLEAAGVPRLHAEAQVQIIAEIVENDMATKQDLKDLEYRLTIKLGTIMVTAVSLTVALVTIVTKIL